MEVGASVAQEVIAMCQIYVQENKKNNFDKKIKLGQFIIERVE